MRSLSTQEVAVLAVLSALCLGIQLTHRPFPNVEFTSLIVFFVGASFGMLVGGSLGAIVMFINGFFSPWGFAGFMMPFQIAGMTIVGVTGGLYRRAEKSPNGLSTCLETAVLGAFLTLVYDIITNFGVAVSFLLSGTPLFLAVISVVISGALFSLVHVVSNFFIFLLAFLPLSKALRGFFGGENVWKRDSLPTRS